MQRLFFVPICLAVFLTLDLHVVNGICPDGWVQGSNKCLLPVVEPNTFDKAKVDCLQREAIIVEYSKSKKMVQVISDSYEITFWINDGTSGDASCKVASSMVTISTPCSEAHSYICQLKSYVPTHVPTYCSFIFKGFYHKENCIVSYVSRLDSRQGARALCAALDGELLDVSDKLKAAFARVTAIRYNLTFWVKYTDPGMLECMKVEPNGTNDASFIWHTDVDCNYVFAHTLCEIPMSAVQQNYTSIAPTGNATTTFAPATTPVPTVITPISTSTATINATTSISTSTTPITTSVTTIKTTTTIKSTTKTTISQLFPTTRSSRRTTPNPENCPYGHNWRKWGKFCFWETSHEVDRRNWNDAREFCRKYGGDLASYADESEEIAGFSTALGLSSGLWIGLKRSSNNTFEWTDGSPLRYKHWNDDEPKNTTGIKDCVTHKGPQFKWSVSYCGIRRWFVCKVPKVTYEFDPVIKEKSVPECDSDKGHWYRYKGNCYHTLRYTEMTWEMARLYCQNRSAHLVSIHSFEETDFIFSFINMLSLDPIWTGLRARDLRAPFTWSDGSPLEFVNWDEDANLGNNTIDRCVAFNVLTGGWSIYHCNHLLYAMCKKRENIPVVFPTPPTTPMLPGFCTEGWHTLGNKCYKTFGYKPSEKLIWTKAKEKCQEIGGWLVTIHSQEEQDLLSTMVLEVGYATWIGMYSTIQGSLYHWVDDSLIDFVAWGAGEPHAYPNEECVEMIYDVHYMGQWNDIDCNNRKAYICERFRDSTLNTPPNDPSKCKEPAGWSKLSSSCFMVYNNSEDRSTWLKAQRRCRQFNAHLAVPYNFGVTKFIRKMVWNENETSYFWIGIKQSHRDDVFRTFSNMPLVDTKWAYKQPYKVSKSYNCVAFRSDGSWFLRDCEENLPFICQYPTERLEYMVNETEGICPNSSSKWFNINGHSCFLFEVNAHKTWFEAMHECLLNGGMLASFHSREQLDLIAPFLEHSENPVHIGFARYPHGSYGWLDGSPVDFTNWRIGEPSAVNELCTEMHPHVLTWTANPCTEERGFICSVPKVPVMSFAEANTFEDTRKRIEYQVTAGGVAGIVMCILVILAVIIVTVYYTCSPWKHRSRRLSDCDTPLHECEMDFR